MKQEDRAAAGVIRERRVKGTRRQSSSRGYKIKKSKVEQEDRAVAGVIRLRRVKGTRRQSSSRGNKRKKSKGNKKTEQQQG